MTKTRRNGQRLSGLPAVPCACGKQGHFRITDHPFLVNAVLWPAAGAMLTIFYFALYHLVAK